MRQWSTLLGFCLANFSNGLGFGMYTNNLGYYAEYFQTTKSSIQDTFYIGLVIQSLFCLFAIRIIEWRFDYAIISSAYLTACAYFLQLFSYRSIVLCNSSSYSVYASFVLNSIAQLCLLPSPLYLAEIWFALQKRSLVIGLGFYSNLLGFGLGGTLSGLLSIPGTDLNVDHIIIGITVLASIAFILCAVLVRNQPKVRVQVKKRVEWRHAKDLWRQKFLAFNVIMVSVFLGVSWSFLSQYANSLAILNLAWIVSGGGFGIIMSWVVQRWLAKTGDYKYYDRTCKITLLFGILGNLVLGTLVQFGVEHFSAYLVTVIFIGIGTVGFFGLAFMSLIQSMYPIPVLLIGTLIALFASVYSIICEAASQLFPDSINPYYSISAITIMPWLYYFVTYETNFKRYKYYLNQKQSKFQLLRIEDLTQKTDD